MKRIFYQVSIISLLVITLLIIPFDNDTSANELTPMTTPLEVQLSTASSSYPRSEVVTWEVNIGGGPTTGPNFNVRFTDSQGTSIWAENIKSYTTSFSLDYKVSGKVTGYVTVSSVGGTATDSHTITLK